MLKKCSRCKEKLPVDDFYFHDASKTIRNGRCKPCTSLATAEWRKKNPEKSAAKARKNLYGISQEEFMSLYTEQQGKCGACGIEIPLYGRQVNVDHDHTTGKVRGLLCFNCNNALGMLKDSSQRVYKLFVYIINKEAGGSDSSNKS